jgi:hypothetical protein
LVRSGADRRLVIDAALQMFAKQAHKGRWSPSIREMVEILHSSILQMPPNADITKSAQVFDSLHRRLSGPAQNHSASGMAILKCAAERTFGALENESKLVTRRAVEEELLCQSAIAVVDHRVLQPTRDEIARNSQRDSSEQACYERDLLSDIGQEARKRLHRTFFENADPVGVRTPARRVAKKETTLERLGEALQVLTGGDQ